MSRIKWKLARISGVITISILLYLLVRVENYPHRASVFLSNTHPGEVWEFVADFSNMKLLNPTITDFKIIDERGNYNHWQYTVEYEETLSHWPHLPNYAKARFSIKANTQQDKYFIHSVHTTCFMKNFLCLNSESEFIFSHGNSSKGAFCEEIISYQCPILFSSFCEREVQFQRNAIMSSLKNYFQ